MFVVTAFMQFKPLQRLGIKRVGIKTIRQTLFDRQRETTRTKRRTGAQILTLLQQTMELGLNDPERITTDKELDNLKERDDFKKFLEMLNRQE